MDKKIRKRIFQLHKWLGLIAGLIIFVICMSGLVYSFYEPLKLRIYPERFLLQSTHSNEHPLPLSQLMDSARTVLDPGQQVTRVDLYPAKGRSWVFRAQSIDRQQLGFSRYYKYYWRIYLDPFTGKVIYKENAKTEFFQVILDLHRNLLLGDTYGRPVIGTAVTTFILLLISGLFLWFPKKLQKKQLKASLWPFRKVHWKRRLYDIHNVLGIYSLLLGLIMCITGFVFAFPAFKSSYTSILNSLSHNHPSETPIHQKLIPQPYTIPLDNALAFCLASHPQADMMSIRISQIQQHRLNIQVRLDKGRTGHFKWYYFNNQGTAVTSVTSSENLKTGDRIAAMNYDIHTGVIWGNWSKIIQWIGIIFLASLPVTGVWLWINKFVKTKKRKKVELMQ